MAKRIDVSLIKNEELRPWTSTPQMDHLVRSEMDALERTITYIAPNMSAGKLGSSVLDGDVPGVREFATTLKSSTSKLPLITKLDPMPDFLPLYIKKSRFNSRPPASGSNSKTTSKPSSRGMNSTTQSGLTISTGPESGGIAQRGSSLEDILNDDDLEAVDRVQRSLYQAETRRRGGRSTAVANIPTVRFTGSISPAVFSLRQSEYHRLKAEIRDGCSPSSSFFDAPAVTNALVPRHSFTKKSKSSGRLSPVNRRFHSVLLDQQRRAQQSTK